MPSRVLALGLSLLLACAPPELRAESAAREYEVKAALLYNFTRFIEWPEESGDFRLCLAGRDPFGADLDALASRSVRERPIRIERRPADLRHCQLVFVAAGQALPPPHPGLLVVAEDAAALERGAAIVLGLEDGRVVFDINPDNAARADLKVSYKLLRLARPLRP